MRALLLCFWSGRWRQDCRGEALIPQALLERLCRGTVGQAGHLDAVEPLGVAIRQDRRKTPTLRRVQQPLRVIARCE